MSLAREMRRGRFLKARLGVNGSQKAARSLGTSARGATVGLATAATVIMRTPWGEMIVPNDASRVILCPGAAPGKMAMEREGTSSQGHEGDHDFGPDAKAHR